MHQVLSHGRKRNKIIPVIALVIALFWGYYSLEPVPPSQYEPSRIKEVVSEGYSEDPTITEFNQDLVIEYDGEDTNLKNTIYGSNAEERKYKEGEQVVISRGLPFQENGTLEVTDHYRLKALAIAFIGFVIIAIAFGGIEAVYALLGLGFSTFIVLQVILKNIMAGADPFAITVIGGGIIAIVSVYMSHGIKKRTTIAVVSMIITMLVAVLASKFLVDFTSLFGLGSEDAFYLITDPNNSINLQGILLAGIIIGTIGILDDIATSQAAAVDEIRKANENLSTKELYKRGISVGKEHISSLINTLFLAYVGAGMPLMLVFLSSDIPAWVLINNEIIAEEIVRTIVGSSALILAVPITTFLAAKFLKSSKH